MKKFSKIAVFLLLPLWVSGFAQADELEQVKATLNKLVPGMTPDSIVASPLAGLYEVAFGTQIVYVSKDGRYLVEGNLIDLEERRNLTEARRNGARADVIKALDEKGMIVFPAKEAKHTVTIFTDIDCPYCRKLHEEVVEYNKLGITVRYLAYPRAGVGSPSYDKTVAVWCADDRNDAMTRAKSGREVKSGACENPVQRHMVAGEMLGVSGTPTIVLENGATVPGYVPAARLLGMVEQGGR